MAVYKLVFTQELPVDLDSLWSFISSPHNLKKITPDEMGFEIINGVSSETKMFQGQIIVYKIKIFPFLKSQWVSEISHVKEGDYFIDQQRSGPYGMWHHLHQLQAIDGGVLMTDTIHYQLPLGIKSDILNSVFVRSRLLKIFDYRKKTLESIFGKYGN